MHGRSTIMGVIVGVIPAAGPDIAAFLCYNEPKKLPKHQKNLEMEVMRELSQLSVVIMR